MGASKGGGYTKKDTLTPDVQALIQQLTQQAAPNYAAASEGYKQFLPGGGGGQPIIDAANKNFQQQTVPSILNAFGTGNKGSSSLNQALAAGASNLNTDLASQLAQMQLQASQGIGNIGAQQSGIAAQTPQFAYLQKQKPLWQSLTEATLGAGGQAIGGWASGGFKT
jgi:hypothetical protein